MKHRSREALPPKGFVALQEVLDASWDKKERRPAIERARKKIAQKHEDKQ